MHRTLKEKVQRWIAVQYWRSRERRAREHLDALVRLSQELPDRVAAEEREISFCATQRVVADLGLPPVHYPARLASREVKGI